MHELGVLCQIVKKVNKIALENEIEQLKHITLEVGEASSFVPVIEAGAYIFTERNVIPGLGKNLCFAGTCKKICRKN